MTANPKYIIPKVTEIIEARGSFTVNGARRKTDPILINTPENTLRKGCLK